MTQTTLPSAPTAAPAPAASPAPASPPAGRRQRYLPPAHVTPSKLRDLELCPLRADLRHRQRVPAPRPLSLEVGALVHQVLEALGRRRLPGGDLPREAPVAPDELRALLEAQGAPPRALEPALSLLERVLPELSFREAVALEEPWTLEIGRDPRSGERLFAGGRWDRVDRPEPGLVRILDYKTGRRLQDQEELLLDDQVGLYLAAARARFPEAERVEAVVWWLERDQAVTVAWSAEVDAFARLRARAGYLQLQRRDQTARVGEHCAFCPYRSSCGPHQAALAALGPEDAARAPSPPRSSGAAGATAPGAAADADALLQERQRLKATAELAEAGRRDLDRTLRSALEQQGELRSGSLRARLVVRRKQGYRQEVLPALAAALGRAPDELLRELSRLDPHRLEALVRQAPKELRASLERFRTTDLVTYVDVRSL